MSDETEMTTRARNRATSKTENDPNLHDIQLNAAAISSTYKKSAESMGEDATTTKPEEPVSRPKATEVSKPRSKASSEQKKNPTDPASNQSITRL